MMDKLKPCASCRVESYPVVIPHDKPNQHLCMPCHRALGMMVGYEVIKELTLEEMLLELADYIPPADAPFQPRPSGLTVDQAFDLAWWQYGDVLKEME